ncbi:unnamed protein product, partial [Discosporangium mesarthrocarpum]
YSDGDTEHSVEPALVRIKGGASIDSLTSDGSGVDFREGDKVEARFGGRSRWFKATVQRKNRDGTYYLRYEDGDEEKAVEKDLIRKIKVDKGGSRSPGRRAVSGMESDEEQRGRAGGGEGGRFRVDEKVEARYGGKAKWFRGTVQRANLDGTYDIWYEDGDEEKGVEARLMRRAGSSFDGEDTPPSLSAGRGGSSDGGRGRGGYMEGDKVEARFRGRSRWFPATVFRKNYNGTFHLRYEDGDEEKDVEKELIRPVGDRGGGGGKGKRWGRDTDSRDSLSSKTKDEQGGGASGGLRSATDQHFRVGDEVEARFRGRAKWFLGKIKAAHRDGTFDIHYTNGDRESNVEPRLIRRHEESRGSGGKSSHSRERGGGRARGGESNSDGNQEQIPGVGDSVEARFRGKSRWFGARVMREHSDGTYDIFYDDGEMEDRVEAHLVRVKDGRKEREREQGR